jgi:MtaA/CmuA family methyltransferase
LTPEFCGLILPETNRRTVTSRERFHGFVCQSPVDRVPVQLQNMVVAAQSTGRDFPVVYGNPDLVVQGHLLEWEKYRHDGVIVDIGTHAAAQAVGCPVECVPLELPRVTGPAISEWADVRSLRLPDIGVTFPLAVVLQAVEGLKKEIGRHAVIIATVDQGPFTLATQVAGLEKMLLALATGEAEEEIHALLRFCTAFTLAYGRELARAGADVIRMGDSISGPDLVSPDHYRRYALGCQKALAREFAKDRIIFAFHICGNATAILADMVSTGAAYVEIDEKTDLLAARDAVQDSGGINGPVSPRTLRFADVAEVERTCREILEAWMPRPGLFFGPGCSLASDTPEENIRMLIDCASRYGSYAGRNTHAGKISQ